MGTIQDILSNPLAFSTSLNIICLKTYGAKYYNFDPGTLEIELKNMAPDIPDINLDKIQAISTLVSTNQFYTYFEPFECIVNCFNSQDPAFEVETPLEPFEICWGLIEAEINNEEDDHYSVEVQSYIKQCFVQHGVIRTPPIVKEKCLGESEAILFYYDNSAALSEIQLKEQQNYEKELNEFIISRLKLLNEEVLWLAQ